MAEQSEHDVEKVLVPLAQWDDLIAFHQSTMELMRRVFTDEDGPARVTRVLKYSGGAADLKAAIDRLLDEVEAGRTREAVTA